jgi:hypothetical protein
MQHHFPILLENIPEKRCGRIILLWKTFKLLLKGNSLTVLQLEQYVFCVTIMYLRSLVFKFGEVKNFYCLANPVRHRWKEIILWVHEMTLTTKPESESSVV